jgi:hypothetical protein
MIKPLPVTGIGGDLVITKIVRARLNISRHSEEGTYLYVLPYLLGYDLILGNPWLKRHDGRLEPKRNQLYLHTTKTRLYNTITHPPKSLGLQELTAAAFQASKRHATRTGSKTTIFAALLQDIEKALCPKTQTDPCMKLPKEYMDFLSLWQIRTI